MKKIFTGINIQWPISQDILSGVKTIETRTYPIPKQYLGQEMLMIETPGKRGGFKARISAIVKFKSCFKYNSIPDFRKDIDRHLVQPGSPWDWGDKAKWGWEVEVIKTFTPPIETSFKKGIIYTKNIELDT